MRKIFVFFMILGMTFLLGAQVLILKLDPTKSHYTVGEPVLIKWKSIKNFSNFKVKITIWRQGRGQNICKIADNIPFSDGISGYKWTVPSSCVNPHTNKVEKLTSGLLKVRVRLMGEKIFAESEWFRVRGQDIDKKPLPDLGAYIKCPVKAYTGQELGKSIKVYVWNKGSAAASNFSVDLVLSGDATVPVKYAVYSPNYSEDVLLQGGREFVKYISAGKTIPLTLNGNNEIPDDIPPGSYFLGVVVDSGNKVVESKETNNVALCNIKVARPVLPDLIVDSVEFIPSRKNIKGRIISDCDLKIRLKNIGGVLPDAAYGTSTGMAIQIWIDGEIRGGLGLFLADPSKLLKTPGGVLEFNWGAGSEKPIIGAGTHQVKIVLVDVGDVVAEANETNNTKTVNLSCRILY